MKRKLLSDAICAITSIGALTYSGFVLSEEETKADKIEHVYVTGSRIASDTIDTARPVSTLTTEKLEIQGITDISTALREQSFNSIGSFRDQSGSSFGQISLVDLKGIGASRTAVLINGRRLGSNPLTGSSAVDLNTIPFSAIERVEVLTDSASALYGADAIGGVVNIIMKKEFDGLEISLGHHSPERDDATTDKFSITTGQSSDKGHVTLSLDYYKRLPVFDADREYSRVSVSDNPNGGDPRHAIDTIGVSSGGNTGFTPDFSDAFRVGECDPDIYIPISNPESIPGGEGCGYGYADISMLTGGIERTGMYIDAGYALDADHELYFENRFTKSDTFGRFAPAVGFFSVAEDAPLNTRGEKFSLFHRFIGHGNRDDNISISELDNLIGLKGSLFSDKIEYDVFARRYVYDAKSEGDTYIIKSIIEEKVADGSYNFVNPLDPDNAEAIKSTSATLMRDLNTTYTNAGFALSGSFASLPGGSIGWASGAEWASEEYKDQYDNLREASNVLGSSGNTSSGERDRSAAFAEFAFPFHDTITLNVAGRYDSYSDFGDEFSPSLSVKWDPINQLSLRASWGEGFKAPNLTDLHTELSQSFEGVKDFSRCRAQGISDADCPSTQVEEYTGGNPELNAETSESFNLGLIVKPIDSLTFSLDYWELTVDDAVTTLNLEDVLALEREGTLPSGVIVNRGASSNGVPGVIEQCVSEKAPDCGIINVFGNLATFDVSGVDLKLNYLQSTSIGDFNLTLSASKYLKYDEQPIPGGVTFDRPGTSDYPEMRGGSVLSWSNESFNVTYSFKWIDSHEGGTAGEEYDAWSQHDINSIWHAADSIDLSFGIRNFTDEDPSVSNNSGWTAATSSTSMDLYDVAGRTYTASIKLHL